MMTLTFPVHFIVQIHSISKLNYTQPHRVFRYNSNSHSLCFEHLPDSVNKRLLPFYQWQATYIKNLRLHYLWSPPSRRSLVIVLSYVSEDLKCNVFRQLTHQILIYIGNLTPILYLPSENGDNTRSANSQHRIKRRCYTVKMEPGIYQARLASITGLLKLYNWSEPWHSRWSYLTGSASSLQS